MIQKDELENPHTELSRASQEGSLSFSQDVPEVIAIAEPLQGLWEIS